MLARLAALSAAALFALTGGATAHGPYGSFHVGRLGGGVYTNDATGAFSHCAAVATYNSGISVFVGMRANREWLIGFAHPAWKLMPGEVIPIALTFDNREQFNVSGSALLDSFVVVPMPQNSSLLHQFRKAAAMTALVKGNALNFALTYTSQLMPVLASCVDRMNRGGVRAAGDFSVAAANRRAWEPKSVTAASSLAPEPPRTVKQWR